MGYQNDYAIGGYDGTFSYLPTYLPTSLPPYLPTYLPTYLSTYRVGRTDVRAYVRIVHPKTPLSFSHSVGLSISHACI